MSSGGKRLPIGRSGKGNSWGGAAVHELTSPLYKGSNMEEHISGLCHHP